MIAWVCLSLLLCLANRSISVSGKCYVFNEPKFVDTVTMTRKKIQITPKRLIFGYEFIFSFQTEMWKTLCFPLKTDVQSPLIKSTSLNMRFPQCIFHGWQVAVGRARDRPCMLCFACGWIEWYWYCLYFYIIYGCEYVVYGLGVQTVCIVGKLYCCWLEATTAAISVAVKWPSKMYC